MPIKNNYQSCAKIRQFDQIAIKVFKIPSIVLMENAARGCTDFLCEAEVPQTIPILCGIGNNGGDGLAMARHLKVRGFSPSVFLLGATDRLTSDASVNYEICQALGIPVSTYQELDLSGVEQILKLIQHMEGDWIVDAILGTGAKLPLRSPLDRLIEGLNGISKSRFAVDLPTGMDGDSDRQAFSPIYRADKTATLVCRKLAMNSSEGRQFCGSIREIDIGAPYSVED